LSTEKQLKIGVLTSSGDAPGMNAAIRAVARTGAYHNMKVYGIMRGYEGLLSAEIEELEPREVSNIIFRGGTLLLTARCEEMKTVEGQERAANVAKVLGLDALIVAGGDGSLRGAQALSKLGVNVIGIPATIDLDMACTEYTIGFDTAINTGMEAINRIRDTSTSHERCSVVEVMGRSAGHLALWCGITGGAEEVMIPEYKELNTERVVQQIIENRSKGKRHNLIVVAEGVGGSVALAQELQSVLGIQSRATVLGHLQRGGAPTALDRMHASVMGYMAVEAVVRGERNKAGIVKDGRHALMDLDEALACTKPYDHSLYEMIKVLAI
jgi:6-phosphofructokinase 1